MAWNLAYKIGFESLDGKAKWLERIDPPRLPCNDKGNIMLGTAWLESRDDSCE
jgi:hypothetical protein